MTRSQLEHIIRSAASIADDSEIVVVGSQAILGQYPEAPPSLLVSVEADIYPRNRPERSDLIDGSIGEESPFHRTFGYYAQGVDETTAVLPAGWQQRLVRIHGPGTGTATGWSLEVHDLLLAKYAAGRDKDRAYVADAIRHGLAREAVLLERLASLPVSPEQARAIGISVRADFAGSRR